jgi:menaquinone-dependent protoporphyrinogen IX oxidase
MIKALVVYYSRSGNTARIARSIAGALEADLEPIVDRRSRKGLRGYLRSGLDAALRRSADIEEPAHDPSKYDLVVIGTPVWSGSPSSPVRAFLARYRKDLRTVAFFCTCNRRGAERTLRALSRLTGKSPADVLVLHKAELRGDYSATITRFARELRLVLEPEIFRAASAA